jgi:hypothetical protein
MERTPCIENPMYKARLFVLAWALFATIVSTFPALADAIINPPSYTFPDTPLGTSTEVVVTATLSEADAAQFPAAGFGHRL